MSDGDETASDGVTRSEASDERKEKAAADAYVRIRSGQHWLDWMFVAEGLGVGRRWAQRKGGTDDIQSPHYKRAFKEWMAPRPWAKDLDSPTRAHLFWCLDWRNDIDQWRETLAQNDRAKLNHPTAMKRRYEATHRERENAVDPNAPKKETSREALVRENEDLWARVKKLERQREAGDGNLFDLERDKPEDIARCIVEEMIRIGRPTKASQINAALTKSIAAAKKRGSTSKAG
jgi:hypothetical protein